MVKVSEQYQFSDMFEFQTKLERINMREEMENDMKIGKGFYIRESQQNLKKSLKSPDSIYS